MRSDPQGKSLEVAAEEGLAALRRAVKKALERDAEFERSGIVQADPFEGFVTKAVGESRSTSYDAMNP